VTKTQIERSESGGAADWVANGVSRMILEGAIGPGDRLKLVELADQFKVGLMPVREALWKLEGMGLVTNIPNRGAVVRGIDENYIVNVYEIRGAIQASLIERAIASATAADIVRIEHAGLDVERAIATKDPKAVLAADSAFHRTIDGVARNEVAATFLDNSLRLIQSMRLRLGFDAVRLSEIVREHAEIVAAIKEGDGRLGAQRMRTHTNGARQSMLEAWKVAQQSPKATPSARG